MTTQRSLAIGGAMGVGKSTIARLLSEKTGVPLVDLDAVIEAEAGKSIEEIFRAQGEAAFRALEGKQLDATLSEPSPKIVSLGGGALVDRARRRALLDRAVVVTLRARPETILARLGPSGLQKRPLLASARDPRATLRSILDARAEAYAEAHAQIDTDDRSDEEIARDVEAVWSREPIVVPLGTRTYRVEIGLGARSLLASTLEAMAGSVLLVTDERVWPQVQSRIEPHVKLAGLVTLPSGEAHKTVASVEAIWDAALAAGLDRKSVLLAVGGGVVGDLTGFAASTLLRGVRFVQVPTTLLAAVDASVGGKTAIDRPQGKNLVGAFHQPSAVLVDPELFDTLPIRELRSGLAEVVKTALVGDAELFAVLEENADAIFRDRALLTQIVRASIAHKARVVSQDERDETGLRATLNFGHTIGHALEAESGYASRTHGEAIALGMISALQIGVARGVTEQTLLDRTIALLARLGLPHDRVPPELPRALPYIARDKKREGAKIGFVLVGQPGVASVVPLTVDEIRAILLGSP